MTVNEAKSIIRSVRAKYEPTEEDEFLMAEALNFLIEIKHDSDAMLEMGYFYYETKNYDLARKYIEMSVDAGRTEGYVTLGYIYYYGRCGEPDYEKAFKYFSLYAETNPDDIVIQYKLADMYKNGYYVEKDFDKYTEIIEKCYKMLKGARYVDDKVPEIYSRLAGIRKKQGRLTEAERLYIQAREWLEERLKYNSFFGNFSIMSMLIEDIYEFVDMKKYDINIYDLYHILKTPHKMYLYYLGREYIAESLIENGECVITFNGKWYRTPNDFIMNAELDGKKLSQIYDDIGVYTEENDF